MPEELLSYLHQRAGTSWKMLTDGAGWNLSPISARRCILLDYYVRALQLKEEQRMPPVGNQIDPRTLSTLGKYGGEEQVHSLVCTICAQVWTDTSGSSMQTGQAYAATQEQSWRGQWYPKPHELCSEINCYTVEQTLHRWWRNDCASFELYMSAAATEAAQRHLHNGQPPKSPEVDWQQQLLLPDRTQLSI